MHADGDRQRGGQQAAEHPDEHQEAQRDRQRLHHQQVALRLLGDLDVDHRGAARPDGDAVAVVGHSVGQLLGVLLLLALVAVDTRDDERRRAVAADQVRRGCRRRGPRRRHLRDVRRTAQLVDDLGRLPREPRSCRYRRVWTRRTATARRPGGICRSGVESPLPIRKPGHRIRWRTGSWRRELRRCPGQRSAAPRTTMTRRGAAMASWAIRCSSVCPPLSSPVLRYARHRLVVQSMGHFWTSVAFVTARMRHRSARRTVVRTPVPLLHHNFGSLCLTGALSERQNREHGVLPRVYARKEPNAFPNRWLASGHPFRALRAEFSDRCRRHG